MEWMKDWWISCGLLLHALDFSDFFIGVGIRELLYSAVSLLTVAISEEGVN